MVQQRTSLPKADWGGRCIATEARHLLLLAMATLTILTLLTIAIEACNFMPAVGQGTQPVLHNSKAGQAYNQEGCLLIARDYIFECNASSDCALDCFNRVVGRGVRAQLQVFKTLGRGWGVRTLDGLRAGAFVCEYTGNIMLDQDAEASGLEVDAYLLTPTPTPTLVPTRTLSLALSPTPTLTLNLNLTRTLTRWTTPTSSISTARTRASTSEGEIPIHPFHPPILYSILLDSILDYIPSSHPPPLPSTHPGAPARRRPRSRQQRKRRRTRRCASTPPRRARLRASSTIAASPTSSCSLSSSSTRAPCTAVWKPAAQRLRPIRPPARPASARSSSGRPPALASLGQLAGRL